MTTANILHPRKVLCAIVVETVLKANGSGVIQNIPHFHRITASRNQAERDAVRKLVQDHLDGIQHTNVVFFEFEEDLI